MEGVDTINSRFGKPHQFFWYSPCSRRDCEPKVKLARPNPDREARQEGEPLEQQHLSVGNFNTIYFFNSKELDEEPTTPGRGSSRTHQFQNNNRCEQTGLYYYGARSRRDCEPKVKLARPSPAEMREYYNPMFSQWLSVDPLAANYPTLSPYNFVANNPIMLFDPDGRRISWKFDNGDFFHSIIAFFLFRKTKTGREKWNDMKQSDVVHNFRILKNAVGIGSQNGVYYLSGEWTQDSQDGTHTTVYVFGGTYDLKNETVDRWKNTEHGGTWDTMDPEARTLYIKNQLRYKKYFAFDLREGDSYFKQFELPNWQWEFFSVGTNHDANDEVNASAKETKKQFMQRMAIHGAGHAYSYDPANKEVLERRNLPKNNETIPIEYEKQIIKEY